MLANVPGWGLLQTHALVDNDPAVFAATAGSKEVSVLMSPTAALNAQNERTAMERLMCVSFSLHATPPRRALSLLPPP